MSNNNRANNRALPTIKSDGRMVKRKRRPVQSQQPKGRGEIYGGAVSQLIKDVNTLRRFINTETHYTDAIQNGQASSSTATFNLLNGLSLGDTTTTRTGQSIKGVKLDLRFNITGSASANSLQMRVLVVYDKQSNAAIFAIADLLAATTVTSPYTFSNQNRFVVMYDESFSLSFVAGEFTMNRVSLVNSNQHVDFNTGNAGTIADITTGSIYIVHFSDQAVNTSAISYHTRYWFVDN